MNEAVVDDILAGVDALGILRKLVADGVKFSFIGRWARFDTDWVKLSDGQLAFLHKLCDERETK